MLTGLVAAAVIVASPQTPASNWVVAGGNSDGSTLIFVDTGKMRREPGGVRVTWALIVNRERTEPGYDYVIVRRQYRCAEGEMRLNYLASYSLDSDAPLASGALTDNWEPVLPNSSGQNELDAACSNEAVDGMDVTTFDLAQIARDILISE